MTQRLVRMTQRKQVDPTTVARLQLLGYELVCDREIGKGLKNWLLLNYTKNSYVVEWRKDEEHAHRYLARFATPEHALAEIIERPYDPDRITG